MVHSSVPALSEGTVKQHIFLLKKKSSRFTSASSMSFVLIVSVGECICFDQVTGSLLLGLAVWLGVVGMWLTREEGCVYV